MPRSVLRLLVPLAAIGGCLALAPAAAMAGQGNSTTPTFPIGATVGDTNLDASIEIFNQSTLPQSGGTSTICNAGDTGLCTGDNGITLVMSCGQVNQSILACTGADPNVFAITSTPTGSAGSGCAGVLFDTTISDAAFGTVRFTPQGGAHVSLSPGATCKIDFKLSVLKVPTADEDASAPGVQTKQLASSRLVSTVNPTSGQGTGTSFGTTISPPPPPPPPVTPPPPPCIPPPGPNPLPPGRELCSVPITPSSTPKGTARISGKSGCVTQNFNITVTGKQIRRVTFYLDGKVLKTLTKPNIGRLFRIAVRPNTLKRGTHRIIAKTTFTTASGTPVRSLRVVFQRCARAANAPQFTG